jgi:hypothetical protein
MIAESGPFALRSINAPDEQTQILDGEVLDDPAASAARINRLVARGLGASVWSRFTQALRKRTLYARLSFSACDPERTSLTRQLQLFKC